jgi:hypothetical protein
VDRTPYRPSWSWHCNICDPDPCGVIGIMAFAPAVIDQLTSSPKGDSGWHREIARMAGKTTVGEETAFSVHGPSALMMSAEGGSAAASAVTMTFGAG